MPSGDLNRILYVTPFDEPISGADVSLCLAIEHLDRRRFEAHVVLPPTSHYAERYRKAGAVLHPMEMSRMRRNYNPFFWWRFVKQLRRERSQFIRLLTDLKISLVHLNMHVALGPAWAARRLRVPVVIHYRAKTNDEPEFFFDLFLPIVSFLSARVICISRAVAQHFVKRSLAVKVEILHNPFDLSRFEAPRTRDANATVLFVGRIDPQKRVHVLLDALQIVARNRPSLRAVFVGDPAPVDEEYARGLKEKSKEIGIPVEWAGRRADPEAFFSRATVFVFPAVDEGFGRVLVEALASGVPVVAVSSGASPEVLDGGKWGQLVPPDDGDALAQAIERVLVEPTWEEIAGRGRVYARENFSVDRHVSKLMEIYDRILSC